MKILLDECLPLDFRHSFASHDTHTAQWAGFKGKKNGDLLHAAEVAGYEVMLTADHGIPHQTYPGTRKLSIILVRSRTNQLEDLLTLADAILVALETIQPGQNCSDFIIRMIRRRIATALRCSDSSARE